MSEPDLLTIEDLHVAFSTRRGQVDAVRGISLHLKAGETLGIVGESGSGKSVTAFAVTGLLDRAGRICGGRILFRGQDLAKLSRRDVRRIHGAAISMIFQNPRAALNPIRTVGLQLADVLRAHENLSAGAARGQALDLLKSVLIRDPEARLDAYPHELSGGMCQRVMIAMAIACEPQLLIADEPTTGLDVTTQKTVMDLLARIEALKGLLDMKDAGAMTAGGFGDWLPLLAATGPLETALPALRGFDHAGLLSSRIDGIAAVAAALGDVRLTLDPTERHGFEYQSWIGFSLFADGVRGEVGRGGSYRISHEDADEPAVGFSLYVDGLVEAGLGVAERRCIWLPAATPVAEGARLRAEGWTTVAALGDETQPGDCAYRWTPDGIVGEQA